MRFPGTLARQGRPALMALAAAGTQFMQVGWLFLPEKLSPDISRIDPLKGFGRIFSMQGVMRLAFGFLKIGIILIVAYNAVIPEQNKILSLDQLETGQIAMYLFELIYWVSLKIAMALLILVDSFIFKPRSFRLEFLFHRRAWMQHSSA